jgi:mannan endo-1,4-beta-mannosidase
MVADLKAYLDAAKTRNILVILVLWNGASLNIQNATNLVWDDSKLQTYIDKALKVIEFTFFPFYF